MERYLNLILLPFLVLAVRQPPTWLPVLPILARVSIDCWNVFAGCHYYYHHQAPFLQWMETLDRRVALFDLVRLFRWIRFAAVPDLAQKC